MAKLSGVLTVFAAEGRAASRRWQLYVVRTGFVAVLLAALTFVWWTRTGGRPARSVRTQAEIGRVFTGALTATQLAMILLAAPAATAGALCLDRARGTLTHVLVTDLSAAEIVLGKLSARLVPVLGMLLCTLPIPALGTLLGGVDPWTLAGAMLVTLGVAVSGCAAALVLSTWGSKPHEVLLTSYFAWSLWLLALPMWWGCRLVIGGAAPPTWLQKANPIWLVFQAHRQPGSVTLSDQTTFLIASVLAAAALTIVSVLQLRRAAAGESSRRRRSARSRASRAAPGSLRWLLRGPSLDRNPVLWREWHRRRPSRWARAVWSLYAAMTIALSGTLVGLTLAGGGVRREVASVGNGFQAGVGLLLLSVSAATALAEERVRGSLDVLMATPLSTRSIFWGKWWGTFRAVPLLAIAPGVVAAALARESGRWEGALLIVALYLAYGAGVTSLGLALATWLRRLDHAVASSVAVLGGVTVGWLLCAGGPGVGAGSPIVGIMFPTIAMRLFTPGEWRILVAYWIFWIIFYVVVSATLGWAALWTFDRCMGRVREAPVRPPGPAGPHPAASCVPHPAG